MEDYSVFRELKITSIAPEGWLRRYLETQASGLTGHMETAGYPFDTKGWASPKRISGKDWWPYEQTGYWLDGAVRCAHLLGDRRLRGRAEVQVEYAVKHAAGDGYIGPAFMRGGEVWNKWPHAVFFRAVQAHYSATGDRKLADAVRRHYRSGISDFTDGRDTCNIEAMLWAYSVTGDRQLLKLALKAYAGFNRKYPRHDAAVSVMLSSAKGAEHGVTYNELCKLGALVYCHTGDRKLLKASVNAYRKLERHHMLADGVHSSSERLCGRDPLASHETCDIADYTWALGYLLMATGEAKYADGIEKACFNAAPGAVRSDFRALQYFSCPNQTIASSNSNHNIYHRGEKWMSYRPNPGTECCPGEVNRIMPNYAARMWLENGNGGVAAALYGPSTITLPLGPARRPVTIVEETEYPFRDEICFQIRCAEDVKFPLTLRIPGWCKAAELRVNGCPVRRKLKAGSFFTLNRRFSHNDRVSLRLPMSVKAVSWPGGGIVLERGPLVYSLRIEEDWRIDKEEKRQTPEFPAWNLHAASSWNYALAGDGKALERDVKVVFNPICGNPWTIDSAPVELLAPARKIKGWKTIKSGSVVSEFWKNFNADGCSIFEKRKVKGSFELTPPLPDRDKLLKSLARKVETVRLVPYGCTHLRITVFPHVKGG